jgi:hypothetical protein
MPVGAVGDKYVILGVARKGHRLGGRRPGGSLRTTQRRQTLARKSPGLRGASVRTFGNHYTWADSLQEWDLKGRSESTTTENICSSHGSGRFLNELLTPTRLSLHANPALSLTQSSIPSRNEEAPVS